MPLLTPILALAIFPVAFLFGFSFNPVEFSWALHHGRQPMSEETRAKAATLRRYANFLGDAIIVGLVAALMLTSSAVGTHLGLHLEKWRINAGAE